MDTTEKALAAFLGVVVALTLWLIVAIVVAFKAQATLPCSAFGGYAARDVPARCISYYSGGR